MWTHSAKVLLANCDSVSQTSGNEVKRTKLISSETIFISSTSPTKKQFTVGQLRPTSQVTKKERCTHSPTNFNECRKLSKNVENTTQQPLKIYCLIIHMDSMSLGPFYCCLKKNNRRNKKIPVAKSGAIGWISGSGSANCVFLLTFNSPKHPCFTAPWAIAFLNLSLERQELWSLSIEEKGMLFPCHPLVPPPSSLPWSTAWLPPYPIPPSLFPTLLRRKLSAMSCHGLLRWGRWKNVLGGKGCWYWFRGPVGSCMMVVVGTALVLCKDACRKIDVRVWKCSGHTRKDGHNLWFRLMYFHTKILCSAALYNAYLLR